MPDLSSKDIAVMKRRIANVLEPGETAIIGFLCGQGVVEFLAKEGYEKLARAKEGPSNQHLASGEASSTGEGDYDMFADEDDNRTELRRLPTVWVGLTTRKTPLFGPPNNPHSGDTPAKLPRHSGKGTEPPGTKRHLQRLPRSLGRNGGNTMSCSRRALDVGAAAPSNGTGWRRSISSRRLSTVNGGTPARTRSLSRSLVNPFSNSLVSLSRSRLSVSNVCAASLSTNIISNLERTP
ncbi:uncharacterized protein HKW66_Vig0154210 [Vigna angularis]|uniref:Uncharacterized protein n=1 Tax=Phaseolus angularis TaxID=3914 RepID=A0A8T0JP80_PHAAN|nr:uncharacterized protein HKW66_Vig0154210 [Vigna angularis]